MDNVPKYPIYIPSKDRANLCQTASMFIKNNVSFKIVLEPDQVKSYTKYFNKNLFLILPDNDMKLLGTRLWIREHSIKNGNTRHWQFDDNIYNIYRLHKGKRIQCNSNIGIKIVEDFTDRYENIGISGFNYEMFITSITSKPFVKNVHVYSACLINNEMPYKWRLIYNDDTDLCLQVLHSKMCTVLFNAFTVKKIETMTMKGGNTDSLYKEGGRLKMARSLEAMWPQYVEVRWRFGRPQHVINWKKHFKHPLIRKKDIDWDKLKPNNYGLKLIQIAPEIKSKELRKFYKENATA